MTSSVYLTLKSPLDDLAGNSKRFDLQRVQGTEALCGDFEYSLEICSPKRLTEEDIDLLLGNAVTVQIGYTLSNQATFRYINGLVFRIKELGMSRAPLLPDLWEYHLEISSWFKQLSYAKECRIFQKNNNTHLSIISDLLTELGLMDFRNQAGKNWPKRDYVTQYNESYYDFITRLLQEEGILWGFEHTENQHILVFYEDVTQLPEIPSSSWLGIDRFVSFCRSTRYHPLDGCQMADFDYDNPPAKLVGKSGKSNFLHFEYPGHFSTRDDGENKASRLKSTCKHKDLTFRGTSTVRILQAGKRITMHSPTLRGFHEKLFIVKKLSMEATPRSYSNSFELFSSKTPCFHDPENKVAKPVIIGHQTAVVTGSKTASGVHTDEQGRVMVRFHWDRHSPDNSGSAYIRNMMPAAGAERGFIFNPRVGDEVLVAFENGDPDRPLIIGRVYSSNQRTPVKPESHPEQSTINPSGEKRSNHIVFDDKCGAENLEINAKKDMKIKVGTDLNIDIKSDLTIFADNLEITATGNVLTGNIVTMSSGDINTNAGNTISNTSGLIVANINAGLALNKAGANGINAALGMVDSSSGGHTISAAPLIFNTTAGNIDTNGKGGVKNIGLIVANTAMELIENAAGKHVGQKADLAIFTNSTNETSTFKSESSTKALLVKDKGEMTINDD